MSTCDSFQVCDSPVAWCVIARLAVLAFHIFPSKRDGKEGTTLLHLSLE